MQLLFECSLFHKNVFADLRNISPPQAKMTYFIYLFFYVSVQLVIQYRT